jgi:hypothetical protein
MTEHKFFGVLVGVGNDDMIVHPEGFSHTALSPQGYSNGFGIRCNAIRFFNLAEGVCRFVRQN